MRSKLAGAIVMGVGAAVGFAGAALGSVPDPSRSDAPPSITLVGQAGGDTGPDCTGAYTVTVRDFVSRPIAGSTVVLDLTACPDIRVACDQLPALTGQAVLPPGKKVVASTDAAGQFTFHVQGAASATIAPGIATSPGSAVTSASAAVYADGVLLGNLYVSALDLDGAGSPTAAVNSSDVSLALHESVVVALGAQARARDDYNSDRRVTSADVSMELAASLATMTCDPGCGCSRQTGPFCP